MAEEDWLLAETRRIIREIEDAETHRAFWESAIQNIEVLVPLEGYDLLLDTHVAGTSYIPTLDRKMAHVDPGTLLTMVREPDNPVDPKAILIMTTEGQKIMMIEPFFESNGVTGRSLAHLVLCKRGFTRNITVPFSVFPATRPDLYNMKLQPYRYLELYSRSDIPRSMASCAVQLATYVEASIDIVLRYMDAIQDVQDEWRQRIPGLKMHSSIDRLLWRLPGEPLLTIPRAVKLTGKSFAAMNTCVSQLCEYGILRPVTSGKRNRFFEAPDILEAYGEIESFYFPAPEPRSDN